MASDVALRVAARYMRAFKYGPKETKQHRVEKLTDTIRDATGLGRGTAESIADAIIRGRDWLALRFPKNWPIDDAGVLEGPRGTLDLTDLAMSKTAADRAFLHAITEAYEDPTQESDLKERIQAVNEIHKELGKDYNRLEGQLTVVRGVSDDLDGLLKRADRIQVLQAFEKAIEGTLTDAKKRLQEAKDTFEELLGLYEKAQEAIDERQDTLLDIAHDAERALK